jgi:hypothetical protein
MESIAEARRLPPPVPDRPGPVTELRGVILQSDKTSALGSWIIRPIEMLDRCLVGIGRDPGGPAIAMHAGLHVILEDGRQFVVEQLFGTPREDFVDGLNWTPLETFRARDHRGWDITIPATAFRNVDEQVVGEVIKFLNEIKGRPFFGEDCTALVERAFGKRRLFADSPIARSIGFGMRIGDPALPLLKRDAHLNPITERLLRASALRDLPDPTTSWDSPNGHLWIKRGLVATGLLALLWSALRALRAKRAG